ncbi:tat twin-arginine translocation pathway signal sequence domain protein [Asticcacaulis biprosthecium C19]|uniref:Tat twin-arginine translocation pathway signal sequence domain protein n=1 Tax=Asticcacaulis biprosthecium C19 TaxID=715226 RepID=F4QH69_9CAUL|nr:tat twin-arginine translocation pathway signal sequence domain protein [Asticcacaulis biprosthecium C19]
MSELSRRQLMTATAALGLATAVSATAAAKTPDTPIVWLDGEAPGTSEGMTFGIPWPRGAVKANTQFALGDVPVQSWPIAYWPDGSLKWSAHATAAGVATTKTQVLTAGTPASPAAPVKATQTATVITVTCGDRQWVIPTSGDILISGATIAGHPVMGPVGLTVLTQDAPGLDDAGAVKQTRHHGVVTKATVEQSGPIRAVIKLDGHHSDGTRQWLPFSVRLYAHAGADSLRIVHSFIWDGDESKDFIRGIGLTAAVPMRDELYDRHIRFTGQEGGVWGEAVRPLTGLRRDTGKVNRDAQVAGRAVPDLTAMQPNVLANLLHIPAWGDFTLSQTTADGYSLKKRTLPGHGWIDVIGGGRASGLVYAGSATGGVALGLKDFLAARRHPSGRAQRRLRRGDGYRLALVA